MERSCLPTLVRMAFWKPGTVAPGSTIDRASEAEESVATTSLNKNASLGLSMQRQRLPIYKQRAQICYIRETVVDVICRFTTAISYRVLSCCHVRPTIALRALDVPDPFGLTA